MAGHYGDADRKQSRFPGSTFPKKHSIILKFKKNLHQKLLLFPYPRCTGRAMASSPSISRCASRWSASASSAASTVAS
ncbi:DUF294 nucleotidyltransferase-like domain-containing protein [Komagataeibacter sucrofermentans]|uniref:DUF294 nucleotidyltransferase-like domain-containing protein n=1 Tax=Komagataeibacter sucrofermentans TaxID=1053551 RepID=UPI000DA1DEB9